MLKILPVILLSPGHTHWRLNALYYLVGLAILFSDPPKSRALPPIFEMNPTCVPFSQGSAR